MTDEQPTSDTTLPRFSVTVVPTSQIRSDDLSALLRRYRHDEIEPLIFGEDNKPEAAIIPFAAFVRLMKQDHAGYVREEHRFQEEISRRVQSADAGYSDDGHAGGLTLDNLGEDLGEPAASMLREQRRDG